MLESKKTTKQQVSFFILSDAFFTKETIKRVLGEGSFLEKHPLQFKFVGSSNTTSDFMSKGAEQKIDLLFIDVDNIQEPIEEFLLWIRTTFPKIHLVLMIDSFEESLNYTFSPISETKVWNLEKPFHLKHLKELVTSLETVLLKTDESDVVLESDAHQSLILTSDADEEESSVLTSNLDISLDDEGEPSTSQSNENQSLLDEEADQALSLIKDEALTKMYEENSFSSQEVCHQTETFEPMEDNLIKVTDKSDTPEVDLTSEYLTTEETFSILEDKVEKVTDNFNTIAEKNSDQSIESVLSDDFFLLNSGSTSPHTDDETVDNGSFTFNLGENSSNIQDSNLVNKDFFFDLELDLEENEDEPDHSSVPLFESTTPIAFNLEDTVLMNSTQTSEIIFDLKEEVLTTSSESIVSPTVLSNDSTQQTNPSLSFDLDFTDENSPSTKNEYKKEGVLYNETTPSLSIEKDLVLAEPNEAMDSDDKDDAIVITPPKAFYPTGVDRQTQRLNKVRNQHQNQWEPKK